MSGSRTEKKNKKKQPASITSWLGAKMGQRHCATLSVTTRATESTAILTRLSLSRRSLDAHPHHRSIDPWRHTSTGQAGSEWSVRDQKVAREHAKHGASPYARANRCRTSESASNSPLQEEIESCDSRHEAKPCQSFQQNSIKVIIQNAKQKNTLQVFFHFKVREAVNFSQESLFYYRKSFKHSI